MVRWVESSDFTPNPDDFGYRMLKRDFIPLDFAKADGITRPILFSDVITRIRSSESDRVRNSLPQTTGQMRCRLIRMLAELQVIITVMATRSHVFVLGGP